MKQEGEPSGSIEYIGELVGGCSGLAASRLISLRRTLRFHHLAFEAAKRCSKDDIDQGPVRIFGNAHGKAYIKLICDKCPRTLAIPASIQSAEHVAAIQLGHHIALRALEEHLITACRV